MYRKVHICIYTYIVRKPATGDRNRQLLPYCGEGGSPVMVSARLLGSVSLSATIMNFDMLLPLGYYCYKAFICDLLTRLVCLSKSKLYRFKHYVEIALIIGNK